VRIHVVNPVVDLFIDARTVKLEKMGGMVEMDLKADKVRRALRDQQGSWLIHALSTIASMYVILPL
jgi:hypothetical protein